MASDVGELEGSIPSTGPSISAPPPMNDTTHFSAPQNSCKAAPDGRFRRIAPYRAMATTLPKSDVLASPPMSGVRGARLACQQGQGFCATDARLR